jgi:phage shock protein A
MGPAVDEAGGLIEKMTELAEMAESSSSTMADSSQMVKTVTTEYNTTMNNVSNSINRNIEALSGFEMRMKTNEERHQRDVINALQKLISDERDYFGDHAKKVTDIASSELTRAGRGLTQDTDKLRLSVENLNDNLSNSMTENERLHANIRKELKDHLNTLIEHTMDSTALESLQRVIESVNSIRTNQGNVTKGFNEVNDKLFVLIDALAEVDVSDAPEEKE